MIKDIKEYKEVLKDVEARVYANNMAVALAYDFDKAEVERKHLEFLKNIENERFVTDLYLQYLKGMREGN